MRSSLYEQQIQLEERMAKLGVDKFRDGYERWTGADRATETRPFRAALNAAIAPMVEAIDAFRKQASSGKAGRRHSAIKLLKKLDSPTLAFITVKMVLDRMIRKRELAPMAVRLSNYLEAEATFADLDNQPEEAQGLIKMITNASNKRNDHVERFLTRTRALMRREHEGVWQSWTLSEKTTVGLKMIELMCQSTGLLEVKPVRKGKNKVVYMVEPTERFAEWLEDLKGFHEVLLPEYLPCIIPPKDWDGLKDGGYHSQAFAYPINLVKTRSKQHRKMLKEADLSQVYKAINAMQRTPWAINTQVLDVAFYLMDIGTGLAGLPHRVLEIPAKPHDIATNEEARKAWGNEFARILRININTKMQRLQAWKAIKMAQEFRKYDKIYFPYQLDFRGRIYSIVSHLTPQGTDLAKGLLHFGEGDAIVDKQARDWLAIHGANCFGLDKVSFEERLAWVENNEQRIIETAQEPLEDLWWTEADSPFCFLAFCFEWRALVEHEARGEVFHSRLAIALDGSCNGLQHYSAMLRDPVAGKAVNLVPSDQPQDIYGAVASLVQDKLRAAAANADEDNPDYQGWAKAWLEFGIDRKITKRPVMVLPYGGRFTSCLCYVREAVEERGAPAFSERNERNKAVAYLAKLVWQTMDELVVSARLAMKWLRDAAGGYLARGEAVSWLTPLGFPVLQYYQEMKSVRIETMLFGKRFQPQLDMPKDEKPASTRQTNGVAPNFVHSLDACALMMTVNAAVDRGLNCFAMIHDSYGTTAAKTSQLAQILREEFICLYEDHNPLSQIESKEEQPFVGGLELSQVKDSPYFFA